MREPSNTIIGGASLWVMERKAPEVYQAMSPFAHADKIQEPLLLIHGQDDNNPGTFPMQSQRLFVAAVGSSRSRVPCPRHAPAR